MTLLICKSVVFVVSVAITIGIVVQVVLLRRAKHSLRSWSAGFYALCFIWLMFRSVFWGLTIVTTKSWHPTTFYILYWTPNPIQFGAFLLLPLFFGQIAHRKTWRSGWKYIKPLYIAFTVGSSIFFIFWSVLAATRDRRVALLCELSSNEEVPHKLPTSMNSLGLAQPTMGLSLDQRPPLSSASTVSGWDTSNVFMDEDVYSQADLYGTDYTECYEAEFVTAVFRGASGVCFFVLAGAMAYFSITMRRMRNWQYASTAALRLTPQELAFTNVSLFAIFFCRGVYQAGSAFQWWYLPEVPLHRDEDINPALLFVFLTWDVLPTLLILMAVQARSPSTFTYMSGSSFAQGAHSLALKQALEKSLAHKQKTHLHGHRSGSLPDYGVFGQLKEEMTHAPVAFTRHERIVRAKRDTEASAWADARHERAKSSLAGEDSACDSSCTDPEVPGMETHASRMAQERPEEESSFSQGRGSRKKRRRNRYTPYRGLSAESDGLQYGIQYAGVSGAGRSRNAHSPSSTDSSSSFLSRPRGPPRFGGGSSALLPSTKEVGSWREDERGPATEYGARLLGESAIVLPRAYQMYGSIDDIGGEVSMPRSSETPLCDLVAAERSYSLALAEQQERQRGLMHGVTPSDLV